MISFGASAQDFFISDVQISGNIKTKNSVIVREMTLLKDSTYSQEEFNKHLELTKNRILNLNLFNSVEVNVVPNELGIALDVVVVEKWYLWPTPFIEFADRNFNVWKDLSFKLDRTNYGMYLFKYNVFGLNHTLKLRSKTGYHDRIGIDYLIPFIGNSMYGAELLFDYDAQDELWLETRDDQVMFYHNDRKNLIKWYKGNLNVTRRIRPTTMAYANFDFIHTTLDTSVNPTDFHIDDAPKQRTSTYSIGFIEDTRDNIFFPVTGQHVNASIGLMNMASTKKDQSLFFELKVQQFNQIFNRFYTAVSGYAKVNTVSRLPYLNRQMFGYDENIRGFEKYVIDGSSGCYAQAAVRFQVLKPTDIQLPFIPAQNYNFLPIQMYLEAYGDGGFAFKEINHTSNRLPNRRIGSIGLGLNTILYNDRVLRLEYSYNSFQEGGFFVHFEKAI